MANETPDEVLDRFNDAYFPGWRQREAARPAPKASTADLRRELDEARRLLHVGAELLTFAAEAQGDMTPDEWRARTEQWLAEAKDE